MVRPPLKKILFPVQRPGVYITAEWGGKNLILPQKRFFCQNFIIFLPKKKGGEKKKDFVAAHWTGNKLFFKGGLKWWGLVSTDLIYRGLQLEMTLGLPHRAHRVT